MRKKILSLDGGGTWALLQAMTLKGIYENTPVTSNCGRILEQFDIVVANSGGSLMLAAMLANKDKDIDEVIRMFENETVRKGVFSILKKGERNGNIEKLISFMARFFPAAKEIIPKYKASRKEAGLINALGGVAELKFSKLYQQAGYEKIAKNLIVCGFDYDRHRAYFFRTNENSPSSSSSNVEYQYRIVDVINAASNAPIMFFDEPVEFLIANNHKHRFWDGAIGGNNNPILVGITEALALYGNENIGLKDFDVLSIGTANNLLPIKGFTNAKFPPEYKQLEIQQEKSSLIKDIPIMAKSIISDPPDAANYIAHMMMGGGANENSIPRLFRLNPMIQPQLKNLQWIIPEGIPQEEKQLFLKLIELEMDAIEQDDVACIKKLGEWWMNDKTPNQAIRARSTDLSCNIGHSTFKEGKAAWLERCGILENGTVKPIS